MFRKKVVEKVKSFDHNNILYSEIPAFFGGRRVVVKYVIAGQTTDDNTIRHIIIA
jgi:hypothetical protein